MPTPRLHPFLLAAFVLAGAPTSALAQTVFTVTNTSDAGAGSLRQALLDANANVDASRIEFDIPEAGPHTIAPASALPFVTAPLTIDGFTQPGASPNTNPLWQPSNADLRIALDGIQAGQANGLVVQAPNSTVRGLAVGRFAGFHGVIFDTADGGAVEGCYIGTDVTGTLDRGNASTGIWLLDSTVRIGGPDPEDRTVISGNEAQGVLIYGSGASGSVIQGTYIGTNAAGTAALGNGLTGIYTGSTAPFNEPSPSEATDILIGGSGAGEGNLIAASGDFGITAWGRGNAAPLVTLDTRIEGNRVGTNAAGTAALGNTLAGILVRANVAGVTIGGAGAGNLVSGNNDDGVIVEVSDGIVVEGNLVGTDATGTEALGNRQSGILLVCARNALVRGNVAAANGTGTGDSVGGGIGGTCVMSTFTGSGNRVVGNWVGTDRTGTRALGNGLGGVIFSQRHRDEVIGGDGPADGNVIAFNTGPGVIVRSTLLGPVAVTRNAIYENGQVGIDLEPAGPTANDPGDGDGTSGSNRLQNFPEVASATGDGAATLTIDYSVPSATAHSAYPLTVEFFLADAEDQEGRRYIGSDTYEAAEAEQQATAIFTPIGVVNDGDRIVATATDAEGNTSEFGAAVTVEGNAVATEPGAEAPSGFALSAAYPNPFNPITVLALDVPEAGTVTVAVFDLLGRRVALLHDGVLAAGTHALRFEAAGLPSGVYAVRASGRSGVVSQRVTLVR